MQRKGKIARLPRALRHELNRRLADNQDGGAILNWLNALPEVKAVLARDFGGEPIGKQTRVKPGKTMGDTGHWPVSSDLPSVAVLRRMDDPPDEQSQNILPIAGHAVL